MPVSFNFVEGTTDNDVQIGGSGAAAITYVETDDGGSGQAVRFTLSADASGASQFGAIGQQNFGGATFPFNLQLSDQGTLGATGTPTFGNDVFTLRFQDTADPSNYQLTGSGANAVAFNVAFVNGSFSYEYLTAGSGTVAGGTISTPGAQVAAGTLDGVGITGIRFTSLGDFIFDNLMINSLTANALNCFCAGTRIATPDGNVPVETLATGALVLTADGSVRRVTWLGRQKVDVRTGDPRKVNPICISAGALGDNIPARDLWVSQDHAIGIDGYLVNAGALVNGSTIYQVARMPLEGFTYYHIETEAHELLLAEGCPAESFVDYTALDSFENADERDEARISEMNVPRISAARMVPEKIRARIAKRAGANRRDAA